MELWDPKTTHYWDLFRTGLFWWVKLNEMENFPLTKLKVVLHRFVFLWFTLYYSLQCVRKKTAFKQILIGLRDDWIKA